MGRSGCPLAFCVLGSLSACSLLTRLDGYTQDATASELDAGHDPDGDAARDDSSSVPPPDVDASRSYRDTVLADGPIAYYRLGDPDTIARDELGLRPGTYKNTVTHAPGAIRGDDDNAAVFDGNGFVDLGDNFSFVGREPYSIEVWVVVQAPIDGSDCVLAKNVASASSSSPTDGYAMYFFDSPRVRLSRYVDGGERQAISSPIRTDTFTHVVGTYDGANLSVYIDGALDGSLPMDEAIDAVTNAFTIGASRGGTTCYLRGKVDEVAIYDKVLPAERIRVHHQVGRGVD